MVLFALLYKQPWNLNTAKASLKLMFITTKAFRVLYYTYTILIESVYNNIVLRMYINR